MALSKIPNLTHSYRGQDYIFVGQLEDYLKELECPICHSIVSKPLLTSCGHLFCRECHDKLKRPVGYQRVRRNIQCPVCQQEHTTVEDKSTNRRVNNLKVKCTNHKAGCEWVGSISDEGQHRVKQDGCGYQEIPCARGCGVTIRRMAQQAHSGECPMRPHNCDYCGDEGPYQCIIGEHLETCRRYPVQCPNGCQEKLPREEVLHEIRLKEVLSAMSVQLQVEECRAHQLEKDMKTKMERIDDLERHTRANTQQVRQLERDTKDKAQHIRNLERDATANRHRISQLERDTKAKEQQIRCLEWDNTTNIERIHDLERNSLSQTEHIHQLERDAEAKTQRMHDLEKNIKEKTKRLRALARDTEAMARQIRSLEWATTTETERKQYLEQIDQLSQAEERLMKELSETQKKLYTVAIILISFMLVMYVFFKQNCF